LAKFFTQFDSPNAVVRPPFEYGFHCT
jgi:hypothetical protein